MINQGIQRIATALLARRFTNPGQVTQKVARPFSSSTPKMSAELGGIPGQNLPFNIYRPWKMTLLFILFWGSASSIPFIALRHQLLK